jgi:long-chain fatty acid transport protein
MIKEMTLKFTVVIFSSFFVTSAQASAFQLLEQNAVNLGNAYSGTAATIGESSSIFTNPAALFAIEGKQVAVSSVAASARSRVQTDLSRSNFGLNVTGQDTDPAGAAIIPGIYYAQRLGSDVVIGLGTTVPFGLKTEYSEDSLARYVATKSEVRTIDIMPTIAYAMSDMVSVGLSADILYVQATLDSHIDGGATGLPNTDATSRNSADAWAYSAHAGIHYHGEDGGNVGLVFRAPVHVRAEGDSISSLSGTTQSVASNVALPASITMSVIQPVGDSVELLGDASWTRWDRFNVLSLEFQNGMVTDTPQHFKNTWRLAGGANYLYNDALTFKMGAAYDKTPVNDAYRTARIPDADRVWLSVGAALNLWKNLNVNVGYAHLFFKTATVDDHGVHSGVTGNPLFPAMRYKSDYKTKADIIGLQLSWDYV